MHHRCRHGMDVRRRLRVEQDNAANTPTTTFQLCSQCNGDNAAERASNEKQGSVTDPGLHMWRIVCSQIFDRPGQQSLRREWVRIETGDRIVSAQIFYDLGCVLACGAVAETRNVKQDTI